MCGIAGFFGDGRREHLVAMTRALAHRGPDDEGFHIDEDHRVFLGFRRLAIIDPAGGKQPMWNEDGSVCVIFNGEIYNQAELRTELERRGHRFRTDHSDTEVLVHGYEEWGDGLPIRQEARHRHRPDGYHLFLRRSRARRLDWRQIPEISSTPAQGPLAFRRRS